MPCSLEFSIGPIVLYVVFWVINLATVSCWYLHARVEDISPEIGDPEHAPPPPRGPAMKSDLDVGVLDGMEAENVSIQEKRSKQRNAQRFSSDKNRQVSTCTRQHKMHICCRCVSDTLYNSAHPMGLAISSAIELCSFRMVTET